MDSIGTVGEWAGAFASLLVGFAVWRVSIRTNELAESANRTNQSLAVLERRREAEVKVSSQKEQDLVLICLFDDLLRAEQLFLDLIDRFEIDELYQSFFDIDRSGFNDAVHRTKGAKFELSDSIRSRLHLLDGTIGPRIVYTQYRLNTLAGELSDIYLEGPIVFRRKVFVASMRQMHGIVRPALNAASDSAFRTEFLGVAPVEKTDSTKSTNGAKGR